MIYILGGLIVLPLLFFLLVYGVFGGYYGKKVSELSGHYWIKDSVIQYSITNGKSAAGVTQMSSADAASFEVIALRVARDKNNVYYRDEVFQGVDRESIKPLWGAYFQDNLHVYYENRDILSLPNNIEWQRAINDSQGAWLISKAYAFYEGRAIDVKDYSTLEVIKDSPYSKDAKMVYFEGREVYGADPTSFFVVKSRGMHDFATDLKHVYIDEHLVKTADPESFRVLWQTSAHNYYFVDKNSVFYAKQNSNVFVVDGADPHGFKESDINHYFTMDNKYLYLSGRRIPNSDSPSYKKINYQFSKDKNNFYRHGALVVDVSHENFSKENIGKVNKWESFRLATSKDEVLEHIIIAPEKEIRKLNLRFSIVKGRVFYNSFEIAGADPETFELINDYFSKDKQFVFAGVYKLKGSTPDSFAYHEGMDVGDPDDNGFVELETN